MDKLLKNIAKLLIKHRYTLSVCESCTGGMLGSIITTMPGSSKYFLGGIIAYTNKVKIKIVGVRAVTLKKYGAVSAQVAQAMAKNIRKNLRSDIGIGITGIAGPGGSTKQKPVGLVYIALAKKSKTIVRKFRFKGNRDTIRKKACLEALRILSCFCH